MRKKKREARSRISSGGSQESEDREKNAAYVAYVEEEEEHVVEYRLRTKNARSFSQLTTAVRT